MRNGFDSHWIRFGIEKFIRGENRDFFPNPLTIISIDYFDCIRFFRKIALFCILNEQCYIEEYYGNTFSYFNVTC